MPDVWKNVLNELEKSVSPSIFSTWFRNISLLGVEDEVATIGVPNVFQKKQLESKYFETIKQAFLNNDIKIKDIAFTSVKSPQKTKVKGREISATKDLISEIKKEKRVFSSFSNNDSGLNPKYQLDNFIIGSNNDLAVSVAKNVIKNPGGRYNPFFLYGGPGLGKTHLVQAIGNELQKKDPNLKILYTPVSHFYSDFINSIKKGKADDFPRKFQKLDVLIIDDFQMIIGKDASQEQFFNIFNDLYNLNKQIIVTCDRLPEQLEKLDMRLTSRLTMAGAIDLQMPSFEDKCAILRAKAEFMGAEIEDDAIEFIAENIKTNIRDLEGEFLKILALSEFRHITPSQLINEGYISTIAKTNHIRAASAKQIVDKVAKYYGLTSKELKSKNRSFNIKNARQVAMYFLSKELSLSTNKIAAEVGVKDHSTVMHGIKKIDTEAKENFTLRDQIEEIKRTIYE